MMDEDQVSELRRFFAALSDENRLRVAGSIAGRDATVQELAQSLRLKDAEVARHVAMLVDCGIARQVDDGAQTRYVADVERLREQRKRLLARERKPSPADEASTPESERLVLRNFFDGERLKEIPANQKHRVVVLEWLARQFEPDTRYPERDVNAIIQRHHPDASSLRRELVDRRYMQREHGVYWRVTSDD